MKTLIFLLISTLASGQCNLTPSEMKARNLYRDTTRTLWGYQDPETCVTVAFVRARDGVMVYRDKKRFLELLNKEKKSKYRDSIFTHVVLDELLQDQNKKLFSSDNSVGWIVFSPSPPTLSAESLGDCYNIFQFIHSQTKELIQWKIPCKFNP